MKRPELKPKQNRRWEQPEIDRLVAMLLDGASVSRVAIALQRSPPAIKLKATQLGVSTSLNLRLRNERNRDFHLTTRKAPSP